MIFDGTAGEVVQWMAVVFLALIGLVIVGMLGAVTPWLQKRLGTAEKMIDSSTSPQVDALVTAWLTKMEQQAVDPRSTLIASFYDALTAVLPMTERRITLEELGQATEDLLQQAKKFVDGQPGNLFK